MSIKNITGLREECGVFAAYDFDGNDVASSIYYGLFALQHRGQESCGMSVTSTKKEDINIDCHKDMGLVNEVFNKKILDDLNGNLGVGHVRYSTAGSSSRENAQPFVIHYIKGIMSMAHNGNLINASELKWKLAESGAIFHTNTDSEVIAYLIARKRLSCNSIEEAVKKSMNKLKGAYALAITSPNKLIGARDPHGFKPLCIGKFENTYFLSSETTALKTVGAEFIRDVKPGEIVTISNNEITSEFVEKKHESRCIFEYIYFARPDSVIDGVSVYHSRIEAGKLLAKQHPIDADMVVGVPESGLAAAMGYAEESKIPYGIAFIKNNYVGRTFIKPTQNQRQSSVHVKLNVLDENVKGKKIIMIDDSIVRGTTVKNIVSMLKKAGALEVHVRISSPPFLYPCFYGTDVPDNSKLIAHSNSIEGIRKSIGADSLGYLNIEDLGLLCNNLGYCDACFTGNYKGGIPKENNDNKIQINNK